MVGSRERRGLSALVAGLAVLASGAGAWAVDDKIVWEPIIREDKPKQWVHCTADEADRALCYTAFGEEPPAEKGAPRVYAAKLGSVEDWRERLDVLDEDTRRSFGSSHILEFGGDAYLKLMVVSPARGAEGVWHVTAMTEACTEPLGAPALLGDKPSGYAFSEGFADFNLEVDGLCVAFPQVRACRDPEETPRVNHYNTCYVGAR
ncbi:MAG: hypothetical protein AAGL49_02170, partial [Pseudomonadota bacterium]